MAARNRTVRIIAGRWRGRRLRFPDTPDLRPTADRRRETLFNWLGPDLGGCRCLDLFAGSGALGFEAASRGATTVVFVESARAALDALESNRRALAATTVEIVGAPVERYLRRPPSAPFDIVFLDPPFARPALATTAIEALGEHWLAPAACIYIESPARAAPVAVRAEWTLARETRGGDAVGRLYRAPG